MTRLNPPDATRLISTARSLKQMEQGVKKGFRPLIKKIEPNPEIRTKYQVVQHRVTGEIRCLGDYRAYGFGRMQDDWDVIIPWTFHYPYSWELPFAAYLVPPDLEAGDEVMLEDLIQDQVGRVWNQGDTYRLERCRARWNGSDFELLYTPVDDAQHVVG
jgi:hypothetical protein